MNDDDLSAAGFEDVGRIVDRINGFAEGDRVAIVNCEYAGAYGKVEHSGGGCGLKTADECRIDCYLVWVNLMAKPEGVEEYWQRQSWPASENTRRFKIAEVIHVD